MFKFVLLLAVALVVACSMLLGLVSIFGYQVSFLVPKKLPSRQVTVPAVAGWVPVNPAGQSYRAGTRLTLSASGRVLVSIRSAINLSRWVPVDPKVLDDDVEWNRMFASYDGGWELNWASPESVKEYDDEEHPWRECRLDPKAPAGALVYGLSSKQPGAETLGIQKLTGDRVQIDKLSSSASIYVEHDGTYLYLSVNEAVLTDACAHAQYVSADAFKKKCASAKDCNPATIC